MFARLLSAALAGCVVLLTGSTAFAYYSTDSSEGQVVFTGMVEIADDTPDFLIMPSYVSRQLLYLAGPLQAAPQKSAAKNDAQVDILGKQRDSKTGKLYARYRYAGTFVLENGIKDVVKVRLPLNLDTVWDSLFPTEQQRLLHLLVEQVVVTTEGFEVHLRAAGLRSVATELQGAAA